MPGPKFRINIFLPNHSRGKEDWCVILFNKKNGNRIYNRTFHYQVTAHDHMEEDQCNQSHRNNLCKGDFKTP